ncbi:hypothetical protein EV359DRAFT_44742 [Lentinula novae-zelandiae]|nr:hypothetical protein EV359DRAFT_44742 [Lentinula novae-zelandiae]
MQEWVKAGKVRSNCVEQCLICLEEYDKQDSVRVLECKHAFHMDCVDRWLLEGRNSCPACRGKVSNCPYNLGLTGDSFRSRFQRVYRKGAKPDRYECQ